MIYLFCQWFGPEGLLRRPATSIAWILSNLLSIGAIALLLLPQTRPGAGGVAIEAWSDTRDGDTLLGNIVAFETFCTVAPFNTCSRCITSANASASQSSLNGCDVETWDLVQHEMLAASVDVVACLCESMGQDSLTWPPFRRRAHVLDLWRQHNSSSVRALWQQQYAVISRNTYVVILLSSYNRPAFLRNALILFLAHAGPGVRVDVLFEATDPQLLAGYAAIASEFKKHSQVSFTDRAASGGYWALMLSKIDGQATNIMIASDDTFMLRPTPVLQYAALQRIMGSRILDFTVSVEFRVSDALIKESGSDALRVSQLLTMEPYLASRPGGGGQAVDPKEEYFLFDSTDCGGHECHNRHIDGPMYLTEQARQEWPQLSFSMPPHPGLLELEWMKLKGRRKDYGLFPARQSVSNVGQASPTVRDDRLAGYSTTALSQAFLEQLNAGSALQAGCVQFPLDAITPAVLADHRTHREYLDMNWTCPGDVGAG